MPKFIIITGNPGDGFEYIGPFDTFDDAHYQATTDGTIDDHEWWIITLTAPDKQDFIEQVGDARDQK